MNSLADEFRTRTQIRHRHHHSRHILQVSHMVVERVRPRVHSATRSTIKPPNLSLMTKRDSMNAPTDDNAAFTPQSTIKSRRAKALRRSLIKQPVLVPEDWHESLQAGCKLWINKRTAEVSRRSVPRAFSSE